MRLERFRVSNFRCVNDSEWIDVADTTAFVGRNESGKTSLLEALASLNGSQAMRELSRARDFPADRLYTDFSESLTVVRTTWRLDEVEQKALAELLPDSASTETVEVGRGFRPGPWVRFEGLSDRSHIQSQATDLVKQVRAVPTQTGAGPDPVWGAALNALTTAAGRPCDDPRAWVSEMLACLGQLQEVLSAGSMEVDDASRGALGELAELTSMVSNEAQLEGVACEWVLQHLPRFIYLERYPMIEGQQNLAEFVARQSEGRATAADAQFAMLLRVAGIDPARVGDLLEADPEERRQTASRAGAVITRTLRNTWTDRALKVRFNLDGEHWNTIVSDPTSLCDVEVNLDQRSRGFRWFFSFYVMLASGQLDGSMTTSLLLLDEPGVHLHATGQHDLLRHVAEDLSNQVLFTTQSPYMVPEGTRSVRTVDAEEGVGTFVRDGENIGDVFPSLELEHEPAATATPIEEVAVEVVEIEEEEASWEGDCRRQLPDRRAQPRDSLFEPVDPALAAAAADLDGPLLLVESLTDYWYLQLASDFLSDAGRTSLPEGVRITPVGNPSAIPLLIGQLGESPNALVLSSRLPEPLDPNRDKTFWIGDFLDDSASASRVDLEELFDPAAYDRFVRYAYRESLGDREIELPINGGRLSERYSEALESLGIDWNRAAPARLVVLGAAKKPELMLDEATASRFERIFEAIIAFAEARVAAGSDA